MKFLFFLGTGKYTECHYSYNGKISVPNHYVQLCMLDILYNQLGINIDEVVLFLTKDAEIKNYLYNEGDKSKPGLKKNLEEFSKDKNIKITPVKNMPNGNNEEEIWEIFEILMENLNEGDRIYFDITHSFRFLPMLAFITLNYSRYIKNVSVEGIFYGSIESLCQQKGVSINELDKKIPLNERIAPIIDLTNFIQLFDWVIGAKEFMTSLNYKMLEKLSEKSVKLLNKEIKEKEEFMKIRELRDLSYCIKDFSTNIQLCRGLKLAESYYKLYKSLRELKDKIEKDSAKKYLKPFKYILNNLCSIITDVGEKNIDIHLKIVELCYENELIQQGLTILEESIITYILESMNLDAIDKNNRKIPTDIAYKIMNREFLSPEEYLTQEENKYIETLGVEIFELLYNISGIRNDINHCGYRNSASDAIKFKDNLYNFLTKAKEIIKQINF